MSSARRPSRRRLAALLAAPLALAPLAFTSSAEAVPGSGSPVWINEVHYDNTGTDTGEAIEVAAPAGSDLTGWSIIRYNGNGGSTYTSPGETEGLGGQLADAGNGWGFDVVRFPTDGLQNGSPDGMALVNRDGQVIQFLSYEGPIAASGGPAQGQTSTDIGVTESGTTSVGQSLQLSGGPGSSPEAFAWAAPRPSSFGAPNSGQTFGPAPDPILPPPPCTADETHVISAVQADGATSPYVGEVVTVEGVVTAIRPGLSGFFLQEEADDQDTNPLTSEGIFVRTAAPAGTVESDTVQVTGRVVEFRSSGSSQTQISSGVSADRCGTGTEPAETPVNFPVTEPGDLERYEGMLVTFPQNLVISEYFNYGRFNEVVVGLPLDGRTRFDTPTAVVEPGPQANALAAEYAKRRITVDDGRGSQNATPPIFPGKVTQPFTLSNTFRGGDTLTDITGVVEHTFGLYRVHPTVDATYTQQNPRPVDPPQVGGDVQVGAFNVLNYFLTLDNGEDWICGPSRDMECRGADDATELQRQRAKIVDAIYRLDADVVGLMEMENTPGVEPAADLVAGLNERAGYPKYDFIDTGVIGTDAIRLGLLYQPDMVRPVDEFKVLDSSVDPRFLDDKNRPSLAQNFRRIGTGQRFTVVVNHLKSKGSDCNDVGDPDTGDGQGNCNGTRTLAAAALADWLANRDNTEGDPDTLIIGDLNSYDHEDPIDVLVSAGYTDLVKKYGGEYAYGYVFDGQVGYLDHALASASLVSQVTGAAEWHINADEPSILDYDTSFKQEPEDALYEPVGYRSSDHDAVLIGLQLTPAHGGTKR